MNKKSNWLTVQHFELLIFSIITLLPCNTIAKPGDLYHICRESSLIILSEANTDSSIVYRVKKGDYLKEIDTKNNWIEVGIIEVGKRETCCGFGWVLKAELLNQSNNCPLPEPLTNQKLTHEDKKELINEN